MEHDETLSKHKKVLGSLSCLPKKVLAVHDLDNATEFVLHGLCNEGCFNLHKAAYFVDNPDFNLFKGVAGFSQAEAYSEWDEMWNHPDAFTTFMQGSDFNQKIRKFCADSIHRNNKSYEHLIADISEEIGVKDPSFFSWDMKHDNKGLLVYEKNGADAAIFEEHFLNSLYLLSFCPVF
jgi:hypothetical protein